MGQLGEDNKKKKIKMEKKKGEKEKSGDVPWGSGDSVLKLLEGLPLLAVQFGSVPLMHRGGSASPLNSILFQ